MFCDGHGGPKFHADVFTTTTWTEAYGSGFWRAQ
jgi:hypothetical protein